MARVVIVGRLPTENEDNARAYLGVYHETAVLVNGRPAYRHEDVTVKQSVWYVNAESGWVIGDSKDIGKDRGVMYAPDDVARVELVKGPWRCFNWKQPHVLWIDAGDLQVLSKPVTSAAAEARPERR